MSGCGNGVRAEIRQQMAALVPYMEAESMQRAREILRDMVIDPTIPRPVRIAIMDGLTAPRKPRVANRGVSV